MGPGFVAALPVERFHGIGPATAARMHEMGILTGADLRRQTREFLTAQFGKAGDYYHGAARGEDERPVNADQKRKSIGAETTFAQDLLQWHEVGPAVAPLLAKVWTAYARAGLAGRTVTVKVKYADFQLITRSRSVPDPIASADTVSQLCLDLLRPLFPPRRGVRLLGVTLGNLEEPALAGSRQLALALM